MKLNNKPISRRAALITAGFSAASLASMSLTGCALEKELENKFGQETQNQSEEQKEWDGESYLPMGSVVKVKGDNTGMEFVVITRRPKASLTITKGDDGTLNKTSTTQLWDYALFPWPAGKLSDFAVVSDSPNTLFINANQISEVLFMGYEDASEKEAQALLASAKESGISGPDALETMTSDIFSRLNGEAK